MRETAIITVNIADDMYPTVRFEGMEPPYRVIIRDWSKGSVPDANGDLYEETVIEDVAALPVEPSAGVDVESLAASVRKGWAPHPTREDAEEWIDDAEYSLGRLLFTLAVAEADRNDAELSARLSRAEAEIQRKLALTHEEELRELRARLAANHDRSKGFNFA